MPQRSSLRVPRRRRSPVDGFLFSVTLCSLTLLVPLVGCSGLGGGRVDPEDKVAVAKRIASNLKEGDRLIASQEEVLRSNDPERRLSAIPTLEKAEALFSEARDLSRESATPRFKLGQIRSLLGALNMADHDRWRLQAEAATAAGNTPAPDVLAKSAAAKQKAVAWLEGSNTELDFYHRFLSRQHPNPQVYSSLSMNFELLGNYAAAEQATRVLLENFPDIDPRTRQYHEQRARGLRERRLDEFDG